MSIEDEIKEIVFVTIGAASMCWENVDKAGVFESKKAKEVGDLCVEAITKRLMEMLPEEKDEWVSVQEGTQFEHGYYVGWNAYRKALLERIGGEE